MGVEGSAAAAQAATGPMVRLEGVRKRFGEHVVLDGIDLTVNQRQVLVVIGPSGSGKSTLLRCINLLEPIQEGRIFLEGEEITRKGANASAIRQRIGIVFQQFNLFPHIKALDNVTLAARRVKRVPRRKAEERGWKLLDRVGLADKANSYPHQLSGGQQQRVAIARALFDDTFLLGVAANDPQTRMTNHKFLNVPYGIGIRKGERAMKRWVDAAILQMKRRDEFWRILRANSPRRFWGFFRANVPRPKTKEAYPRGRVPENECPR